MLKIRLVRMGYFVSAALILTSIIHLLPFAGVLGVQKLETLYGVTFNDPNTLLLMRHRAILFGMLGLFFLFAAFRIEWQWVALLAALISTLSFILLADDYNASVAKVILVDKVALTAVVMAIVSKLIVCFGPSSCSLSPH